mmetsp:Transcript_50294/g.109325  ORF Transcript_50294/g.109325 Transcript_50294/m.109325 type:complete len:208 (-) Transcript_50294:720-1343(-)
MLPRRWLVVLERAPVPLRWRLVCATHVLGIVHWLSIGRFIGRVHVCAVPFWVCVVVCVSPCVVIVGLWRRPQRSVVWRRSRWVRPLLSAPWPAPYKGGGGGGEGVVCVWRFDVVVRSGRPRRARAQRRPETQRRHPTHLHRVVVVRSPVVRVLLRRTQPGVWRQCVVVERVERATKLADTGSPKGSVRGCVLVWGRAAARTTPGTAL